jgi:hypothetical protein
VGRFLLRWVGLDVLLTLGGGLLRLNGALRLGAASLVEGAAALGILGRGHWSQGWAAAARQRWADLSAYGQTVRWMDVLLAVHGYEVFQTSMFNADPHPAGLLTQGVLGVPQDPFASRRGPLGSSADRERAIGNAPALVPGPLAPLWHL